MSAAFSFTRPWKKAGKANELHVGKTGDNAY